MTANWYLHKEPCLSKIRPGSKKTSTMRRAFCSSSMIPRTIWRISQPKYSLNLPRNSKRGEQRTTKICLRYSKSRTRKRKKNRSNTRNIFKINKMSCKTTSKGPCLLPRALVKTSLRCRTHNKISSSYRRNSNSLHSNQFDVIYIINTINWDDLFLRIFKNLFGIFLSINSL